MWHLKTPEGIEEVALEKWAWMVVYRNKTTLNQFDDQGIFHQITEINHSEAKEFILYETAGKGMVKIVIPDRSRIVHKYVNTVFNANTAQEERVRTYVIGWEGEEGNCYTYVLPNGKIVQSNRELQISEML